MDLSSKDYDRVRASRRRRSRGTDGSSSGDGEVLTRACAVPGCSHAAEYRAPKGRDQEGQYFWFCLDHVREYNRNYNYFAGMKDDDVLAYQREAITGHRPTKPIGVRGPKGRATGGRRAWHRDYDDPFGFFGERHGTPEPERRVPKGPEREAFDVMGLSDDASKDAIKARYKTLVKRHHPDANQGDRGSEERLRSVINAYGVLRRAGYC